jgi:hypothetical protein
VREQLIEKRQRIDVPSLQRLLQFVSLRLEELGITLRLNVTEECRPMYQQILEVFPPTARQMREIQTLAATMASVHVIAQKAVEAIEAAPAPIQDTIDGKRYEVAKMLAEGSPGSGETVTWTE